MVSGLVGLPRLAMANPGDPFPKGSPIFFFEQGVDNSGTASSSPTHTQLYRAIQNADGTETITPEGAAVTTLYNSMGFHLSDMFLYALIQSGTGQSNLLQIGQGGVINNPGGTPVQGLPVQNYNAGTFGDDAWADTLFVRVGVSTGTPAGMLYEINVSNPAAPTATSLPLKTAGGAATTVPNTADLFFYAGYVWSFDNNSGNYTGTAANNPHVYRIDPTTGIVTTIALTGFGIPMGNGLGAQWVYGNGNVGVLSNDKGIIYQIAISDPTSTTLSVSQFTLINKFTYGQATSQNDGASYPGEPIDLGITKTGPVTFTEGTSITYTLKITNNSAYDSTGFVVTDALPSQLLNPVATPDTNVTIDPTTHVLVYTGTALAAGASVSITVSGDTDPNSLTPFSNTATVLGNEADDVSSDDSSTVSSQPVAAIPNVDVAVSYVDDQGNPIPGTSIETSTMPQGTSYDVDPYTPGQMVTLGGQQYIYDGPTSASDPASGTADTDKNVVLQFTPAAPLTVEYLGPDGQPYAPMPPSTETTKVGTPYSESAPDGTVEIDGVSYVWQATTPESGIVPSGGATIIYQLVPAPASLTVTYKDTDGNTLMDSVTTTQNDGSPYTTTGPGTITGDDGTIYTLTMPPANATGTINGNTEVDYVYAPTPADVITHFVDSDGNILQPQTSVSQNVGTDYTTTAPQTITGDDGTIYTLTTVPSNSDGTVTPGTTDVTYVYAPTPVKLTTNYVDTDGNTLAPQTSVSQNVGTDYTTTAPQTITGDDGTVYVLTATPSNADGTINGETTVTYVYTPKPLKVVTNFVDANGNPIQASTTDTSKVSGDSYTTTAPQTITTTSGKKYVLQGISSTSADPASGTLTDSDADVTYVYVPAVDLTVQYLGPDGKPYTPLPTQSTTNPVGTKYAETVPFGTVTIDGVTYTWAVAPSSDPQSGSLQNDTTVTYQLVPLPLNVTTNFVDENGNPIQASTQKGSTSGSPYSTAAPKIITTASGKKYILQGISKTSDPTSGTLKASDANVTYTYVPANTVTVKFLDQNGKPLSSKDYDFVQATGTSYNVKDPGTVTIDGVTYRFVLQTGSDATSGTLNTDKALTYKLVPVTSPVTTPTVTPPPSASLPKTGDVVSFGVPTMLLAIAAAFTLARRRRRQTGRD